MASLAVTTSGKPDAGLWARAEAAARRWGLPLIERRRKEPVGPILERAARALLVFGHEGVALRDRTGVLRFSPGMALLRVKRLDAGADEDIMVRLSQLAPADEVLDCTLGLGADALVAARAVGPSGRVVGLEKSLPLCALAFEGLGSYAVGPRSCRVEVRHADADAALRELPSRSFDCVLLDPMFERPRRSSPAFDMLRRFAEHAPLTPELLAEARRVARRWVIVKAARYSEDLARLGLTAEPGSRYATVSWGRAPALPACGK